MVRHSTCPYLSAKFAKSVLASPRWSFGLKKLTVLQWVATWTYSTTVNLQKKHPHLPDALAIKAVQLQQVLQLDTEEVQLKKNQKMYILPTKKDRIWGHQIILWISESSLTSAGSEYDFEKNTDLDWLNLSGRLLSGISGGKAKTAVIFRCLWQHPEKRWTNSTLEQLLHFQHEDVKKYSCQVFRIPKTANKGI